MCFANSFAITPTLHELNNCLWIKSNIINFNSLIITYCLSSSALSAELQIIITQGHPLLSLTLFSTQWSSSGQTMIATDQSINCYYYNTSYSNYGIVFTWMKILAEIKVIVTMATNKMFFYKTVNKKKSILCACINSLINSSN